MFVFQTYTCLSYTDLHDFDANEIKEVKGMKVYIGKRAKTKQTFTIPLLSPALAILKKYQNLMSKFTSSSKKHVKKFLISEIFRNFAAED